MHEKSIYDQFTVLLLSALFKYCLRFICLNLFLVLIVFFYLLLCETYLQM